MNKKLFKLPILTLIGGIVFYILNFAIIFFGYGGTWSPRLTKVMTYIPLALSGGILILIGMILRKTYDRKDFFRTATLLVVYSIVILIFQQLSLYLGIYNEAMDFILYLPLTIFTIITSSLVKQTSSESINWMYLIASLFLPYIFVLFGKSSKR